MEPGFRIDMNWKRLRKASKYFSLTILGLAAYACLLWVMPVELYLCILLVVLLVSIGKMCWECAD